MYRDQADMREPWQGAGKKTFSFRDLDPRTGWTQKFVRTPDSFAKMEEERVMQELNSSKRRTCSSTQRSRTPPLTTHHVPGSQGEGSSGQGLSTNQDQATVDTLHPSMTST